MSCTVPILKSQSELTAQVMGLINGLSIEQATVAINSAMGEWSSRVKSCFCYTSPDPLRCGVCEYPLPCCGIRDVVVWVRPHTCGCKRIGKKECCSNACWYQLEHYELSCDNLITDGTVEGEYRLEIYIDNPRLPTDCPVLAKDFIPSQDDAIWIKGRVELPPLGWLRLGDCDQDYVSFRCWEQSTFDFPPGFDASTLSRWADPNTPVNPMIPSDPGVSESQSFEVADVDCGVNTVAYTIDKYCFSRLETVYKKGEQVQLALAMPNNQALSALENSALSHAYKGLISICDSQADRAFMADLMQTYFGLAERDMLGYKGDRQPRQRNSLKGSFWFNGGKRNCQTKRRPRRIRHSRTFA